MDQLYKKIEIKGDRKNLPELGNYCTIHRKGRPEAETECYYYDFGGDFHIIDDFDWYLQPFTPDSKAVIMPSEQEISDYASLQVSRYLKAKNNPTVDLHKRFRDCIKWFRSQVREVELKDIISKVEEIRKTAVKIQSEWNYPNEAYIEATGAVMTCDELLDYLSARKEGK